jgi:quinol monooxygenase YgiN
MILVTLRVTAPPGRREDLLAVFWLLLGPVGVEPGCLGCWLYEEAGDGDALLYVEEWETPEHLQRHLRSARYGRLLAAMEASARPPVLHYHWVSTTRGLEYLEAVRLGIAASPPQAPDKAITECHRLRPGETLVPGRLPGDQQEG